MRMTRKVVIIEDEKTISDGLTSHFRRIGYDVFAVGNAQIDRAIDLHFIEGAKRPDAIAHEAQ